MRPYRARFRGQGVFFAFQSWAGCITNILGFDLRQAHAPQDTEEIIIPALLRDRTRQTRSLSSSGRLTATSRPGFPPKIG